MIKQTILKNCTPFTNCLSEINSTKLNNANDLDAVTNSWLNDKLPLAGL